MWTVTIDDSEYVVWDHNNIEQSRISFDDGISTLDVKVVMRQRAATLKNETVEAGQNRNVEKAIGTLAEWATVIEEMAGDQIQLPHY